jgi:hypothetical protein
MNFKLRDFDVSKYDSILARGLSKGLGKVSSQVCIEAAICQVLDLPHDDDPGCVAASVRRFKIRLNDSNWSSPSARAAGLRDLGLAQLGSLGVVSDVEFTKIISEQMIRKLIPTLFREVFPKNIDCLIAADECEEQGTVETARKAQKAAAAYATTTAAANAAYATAANAAYATAANAAYAAAYYAATYATTTAAANAAAYIAAYYAATNAAAADAADAAVKNKSDKYLLLSAQIALDALKQLNSPGVSLL